MLKSLNKVYPVNGLSEIFQSLDIKFAFVDGNNNIITTPAKCRDFLGDVIWGKRKGEEFTIYGFSYNYKKLPYDDEVTRLYILFPNKESKECLLERHKELQELEAEAGTISSELHEVEGEENSLVLEADKEWQQAPWKMSLYSFLIKRYSVRSDDLLQKPDDDRMNVFNKIGGKFILSKVKKIQDWYLNDSIWGQHDNTGFKSVFTDTENPMYKTLYAKGK